MTSLETHNLNICRGYCDKRKIPDAFYELLANALSANPASRPKIIIQSGTVFIEDSGPGILPEHFTMGGSNRLGHSNHGIGLKDAIAILLRDLEATVAIRSRTFRYELTFKLGSLQCETLHLVVFRDLEDVPGTKIEIKYDDSHSRKVSEAITIAKQAFLVLREDMFERVATEGDLEMYRPRNQKATFSFIFVNGARKETSRPFQCIYNLTGELAAEVLDMVNRDQTIPRKNFNHKIYPKIQEFAMRTAAKGLFRSTKKLEFAVVNPPKQRKRKVPQTVAACPQQTPPPPLPRMEPATAPQLNRQPIPVDDTFHPSLIRQVSASLCEQNSPLTSLSPGERQRIHVASEAVKQSLRHIDALSIDRIRNSGSVAKNTAVPHSVDVDMVVFLNNFDPRQVPTYARIIKTHLASRDCRFLSSANDILECVYQSINIDIVLTSAADIEHPRYCEFQEGPEAVTYFQSSIRDHAWVAEVVRAAKYWVMRCNDDNAVRVKSLAVELVVLEVFKANEDLCASRARDENCRIIFRDFLRFLARPPEELFLDHLPGKQAVFHGIKTPLERYRDVAKAALRVLA